MHNIPLSSNDRPLAAVPEALLTDNLQLNVCLIHPQISGHLSQHCSIFTPGQLRQVWNNPLTQDSGSDSKHQRRNRLQLIHLYISIVAPNVMNQLSADSKHLFLTEE